MYVHTVLYVYHCRRRHPICSSIIAPINYQLPQREAIAQIYLQRSYSVDSQTRLLRIICPFARCFLLNRITIIQSIMRNETKLDSSSYSRVFLRQRFIKIYVSVYHCMLVRASLLFIIAVTKQVENAVSRVTALPYTIPKREG